MIHLIVTRSDKETPYELHIPDNRAWLIPLAIDLMVTLCAKSADYASPSDDMENFRGGGIKGIVNRMMDKFQRIRNFVRNGSLQNESFQDACLDLAGYAFLLIRALSVGVSVEGDLWEDKEQYKPDIPKLPAPEEN